MLLNNNLPSAKISCDTSRCGTLHREGQGMVAVPSLGCWSTTSEGAVLPAMALVNHMASAQNTSGGVGGTSF